MIKVELKWGTYFLRVPKEIDRHGNNQSDRNMVDLNNNIGLLNLIISMHVSLILSTKIYQFLIFG